MSEEATAAIVPAASSQERGQQIAEFLDDRMHSNHERKGKKTGAKQAVRDVREATERGVVEALIIFGRGEGGL